jgi:L-lactate utilization protein LutC
MMRLPALTGWGYSKDFPRFAAKPFRARWNEVKHNETRDRIDVNKSPGKQENKAPEKADIQDIIARFTGELIAVHGQVHNTQDATQSIIEFLHSRDINQIQLEPNVLKEEALAKAGINFSRDTDPAIRVGVTKAGCGLADTGSMLATDGEGSPLHASLLPEIHLAVLRTSQIYPSLENAIHLVRESKSAVFITGPSATGDIESVHTIGVHGPGEVHAFLVDDTFAG